MYIVCVVCVLLGRGPPSQFQEKSVIDYGHGDLGGDQWGGGGGETDREQRMFGGEDSSRGPAGRFDERGRPRGRSRSPLREHDRDKSKLVSERERHVE